MADIVLTDVDVTLNAVDMSAHVKSVTLSTSTEALESSTMGSAWRTFNVGPDGWTASITFLQDFDSSQVEDTLKTIFSGRALVAMIVIPTSETVSETNPSYTGNVAMTEQPIIDGSWGENAEVTINLQGSGVLTRAESA
jgi:hypothetical protein